jgi:hypothetical protein
MLCSIVVPLCAPGHPLINIPPFTRSLARAKAFLSAGPNYVAWWEAHHNVGLGSPPSGICCIADPPCTSSAVHREFVLLVGRSLLFCPTTITRKLSMVISNCAENNALVHAYCLGHRARLGTASACVLPHIVIVGFHNKSGYSDKLLHDKTSINDRRLTQSFGEVSFR